jgi:hypothetical protein
MAKITVAQLADVVAAQDKIIQGLMHRMDTAAIFCKVQAARIAKLEGQGTKPKAKRTVGPGMQAALDRGAAKH